MNRRTLDSQDMQDERPTFELKQGLSAEDKIERILSIIVRQRSLAHNNEKIGHIRVFDISRTADSDILLHDPSIKKVYTLYDLREALNSPIHAVILIPEAAAIDRIAISEVCEHYQIPKTVFVESSLN